MSTSKAGEIMPYAADEERSDRTQAPLRTSAAFGEARLLDVFHILQLGLRIKNKEGFPCNQNGKADDGCPYL